MPVIPGRAVGRAVADRGRARPAKESIKLVQDFQNIVGGENQARVAGILANVEEASGKLQTALDRLLDDLALGLPATGQISAFTDKLDPIAESVTSALGEAETTLVSMTAAFDQAQPPSAPPTRAEDRRWRSAGRTA